MEKSKIVFLFTLLMNVVGIRGFAQVIEVEISEQNNFDSNLNFTYTVEQGIYSDYCDQTLSKESWIYPDELLTQLKSVSINLTKNVKNVSANHLAADYDFSYDADGFDFVAGRYCSTEDSVLVRISPVDADLTDAEFTLLNSKGEDLVAEGLMEVAGVRKCDGEDGLWVVKFKVCGSLVCNSISCAVAVQDAGTVVSSNNNLSLTAVKAKHAYDFTANGIYINAIHNRYISAGESFNGMTTWTDDSDNFPTSFGYELTWRPMACGAADAYSSILFNDDMDKDNVCDRYDHNSQQQQTRVWSGTDNRHNQPNLQCYFSKDQAPEGETGEWAKIEIEFPQFNSEGEPTPIRGFFVTLDQHFSIEPGGSELSAWTTYVYKNVALYNNYHIYDQSITLQEGNKGAIYIKNANNIMWDVIGFRVHAVNLDGTLTDPDGRAFYAEMAGVVEIVPSISIVTDEQNNFDTNLNFGGYHTVEQGLYSDYCDKTLAQESWSFPGDYLSQLKDFSSDYDYSYDGTGFEFVDGRRRYYKSNMHSDSLLFRISPADTDLTDAQIFLYGINGLYPNYPQEYINDLLMNEGWQKYNDEEGLWVVKFSFRAGQSHGSMDPKSCALAVKGKDFEIVSDYVITFGNDPIGHNNNDFVVNGVNVNEIHNRYISAGESPNGMTIWTDDPDDAPGSFRQELTWQPMACGNDADAYSSILLGDNVCDRYDHDCQEKRDVSGTDNRYNQPNLLCYFSEKQALESETGEWSKIEIVFPGTSIRGFFVTLDQHFASDEAELNRWTSYVYENVAKYDKAHVNEENITLQSGNSGFIRIKNDETIKGGDVIGFRVHAVNLDGTLTDPDGRAFYVQMLQKGDVTGDGELNADDVKIFVEYFMGRGAIPDAAAADVNGDGVVNIADVVELIKRIMQKSGNQY